jgi:enoyl-CoA hydratase
MAVEISERDGVAVVECARPPVNAVDLGFAEELGGALERVADARGPRAVVVTGRGDCFSAGLDVKVVPRYGRAEQRALVAAINRMVRALDGMRKPVVAAAPAFAAVKHQLRAAALADLTRIVERDDDLLLTHWLDTSEV